MGGVSLFRALFIRRNLFTSHLFSVHVSIYDRSQLRVAITVYFDSNVRLHLGVALPTENGARQPKRQSIDRNFYAYRCVCSLYIYRHCISIITSGEQPLVFR